MVNKETVMEMLGQGKVNEVAALGASVVETLKIIYHTVEAGLILKIEGTDPRIRNRAISALAKMGKEGITVLITKYAREHEINRRNYGIIIEELIKRNPRYAIEILEDKDCPLRVHTATLLGNAKSKEAVPALIMALEDEETRTSAIEALGKIKDPAAIPYLEKFLVGRIKTFGDALGAIGGMGEIALPALLRNLFDEHGEIRYFVVLSIESIMERTKSREVSDYFNVVVREHPDYAAKLGLARTREILTTFVRLFEEKGDLAGAAAARKRSLKMYRRVYAIINWNRPQVTLGSTLDGLPNLPERSERRALSVRRACA